MKTLILFVSIILVMNGKAQDATNIKLGPQGGVTKTVGNYTIEMLNTVAIVYVYLYDKSLNPVSNSGVLSEIVFCFPYDECLNKPLNPLGKSGFSVSTANPYYNDCEINLIIDGKPISAKFTNSLILSKKNK